MLIEFAGILVVIGLVMLVVGIFIARQYTLRAKLLTAFLMIVMVSLGVLSLLDSHIMQKALADAQDAGRKYINVASRLLTGK